MFICLTSRTTYPSFTHSIRVYNTDWEGGGGGRVEPERRLEEQQFTKLDRKYQHDCMYLQSINSDKPLPQSPFTGQYFYMTTFCFCVYVSFLTDVAIEPKSQSNNVRNVTFLTGIQQRFIFLHCVKNYKNNFRILTKIRKLSIYGKNFIRK